MRKYFATMAIIVMAITCAAAEPDGYYDLCTGKSGAALMKALESAIITTERVSYDGLWEAFKTTDNDGSGLIIDRYSTKHWKSSEQCGNYSGIGSCYNREHSFPKSWFGGKVMPMYSDLFHMYPTDGYVNNQRSNHPYGECANGVQVASRGDVKPLGKLGNSTFEGYSGTVFEPDDEYKGDFARSYFYMVTRYNSSVSGWSSPMLAGNSMPAFSGWAKTMLLKWHREDPVSDLERRRNEAVYAKQGNRNPYIDHPELAEYIWGDKAGQSWTATSTANPAITRPSDGSTLMLGEASTDKARTFSINVAGTKLTSAVSAGISGTGFSLSTTSLTAAQVNAGATLKVTYTAPASLAAPATVTGKLSLRSGSLTSTVTLSVNVIDGVGLRVKGISDEGFTVSWVNIEGPGTLYQIHLTENGRELEDWTETVEASDEEYTFSNLESGTTYGCYLSSPGFSTEAVYATTAMPPAQIDVVGAGKLEFNGTVDAPTEAIELTVETVNVDGNIEVSTSGSPFEVSADKAEWGRTLILFPDEDRFYVRANTATAGLYEGTLTLIGGDVEWDGDLTARIVDVQATTLVEDFEAGNASTAYSAGEYVGTACLWTINDAAHPEKEQYEGTMSMRFGNTAASSIAMAEDRDLVMPQVSFYAARWNNSKDGDVTLLLEYSLDMGVTWDEAETFTVSDTDYRLYEATVHDSGKMRVRLRQTAGKRMKLDLLTIKSASASAVTAIDADKQWDAFARDGELVIETTVDGQTLSVYDLKGRTLAHGTYSAGERTLSLEPGLYIVASETHARRVVIR